MTDATQPAATTPARAPGLKGAKVLVASDLSPASDEALAEADSFARLLGASLAVLHVIPLSAQANVLFPQKFEQESLRLVDLQERVASALLERVAAKTGRSEKDFELLIESGRVDATIVRVAEEIGAGLVVVGSHGAEGFGRRVLGSVADRVVRHAHCPVLVSRWQAGTGKVLAATDLSDPSYPAVEMAARIAALTGSEATVLHVVESAEPGFAARLWGADEPPAGEAPDTRALAALRAFVAEGGTGADLRVVEGSPASAIVAVAEELPASLVVVGCHGRTGLERLLLGSVAEKVLRAASCSVLAVRVTRGDPA